MKKMNDHTYALRRKVMDVIYEAKKKGYEIPRIEVRIVEGAKGACAYAYLGKNIVHVDERYIADKYSYMFTQIILHELGHAVFGLKRVVDCRLMDCKKLWKFNTSVEEAWEIFEGYYKKWKR